MHWGEIADGFALLGREGDVWTLPAARNKTKVDLIRPLSETAQAILRQRRRIDGCTFVFSNDGRVPIWGFSFLKKRFDKKCNVTGWQLHDLRRTARSLLSRAGVSSEHSERCLGHAIGGVRGVYDRHRYLDEMRAAYEKLARLISQIVDPQPNVVLATKAAKRSRTA